MGDLPMLGLFSLVENLLALDWKRTQVSLDRGLLWIMFAFDILFNGTARY